MIPVGPFQGRLVRDPEFSYTQNAAMPVWKVTLASDEPYWNSQERRADIRPIWVRLECIGDRAESLHEMALAQGDEIVVTGRLGQFVRTQEDGKKDAKTHVIPLMVEITRRKSPRPQNHAPAAQGPPQGGESNDPWATAPPADSPPF